MSVYFVLVYINIVSMLLDVLALYVADLQVEDFPITVSSKPEGGRRRTREASVKVRRYRCIARVFGGGRGGWCEEWARSG